MEDVCNSCGKCCKKKWLIKLSGKRELELFKGHIVFGQYIDTSTCPHFKKNKCTIHQEKPFKCKQYFCEGNPPC